MRRRRRAGFAAVFGLDKAGEPSRAARALESSRPAPVTEDTIQTLRELHPAAPSSIPDWVATIEPVDTCLLSPEILHAALTSAPSLSAGGPSGLVYEHYRDIFGIFLGMRRARLLFSIWYVA
jgi:hypothetical protein